MQFIFLLFLYVSAQKYKKLSKYSSVSVKAETRVYLDIDSYKTGDTLKFEFSLDLLSTRTQQSYSFLIGQTTSSSYLDYNTWEHLSERTSYDLKCDSFKYCTAKYQETKQSGTKYMYIIPKKPPSYFYWNNDIKVAQKGGLSAGAIAGIVIGCVAGVVILIVIIYYCCCRKPQPAYVPPNPTVTMTYSQPTVTPIVQTVIAPVQPVIQPVQPVVPTYGPPPPQPYYPPTVVY